MGRGGGWRVIQNSPGRGGGKYNQDVNIVSVVSTSQAAGARGGGWPARYIHHRDNIARIV